MSASVSHLAEIAGERVVKHSPISEKMSFSSFVQRHLGRAFDEVKAMFERDAVRHKVTKSDGRADVCGDET